MFLWSMSPYVPCQRRYGGLRVESESSRRNAATYTLRFMYVRSNSHDNIIRVGCLLSNLRRLSSPSFVPAAAAAAWTWLGRPYYTTIQCDTSPEFSCWHAASYCTTDSSPPNSMKCPNKSKWPTQQQTVVVRLTHTDGLRYNNSSKV